MADTSPAQLNRRLEEIHEQYRQHFAGRSRVTRDPALLDSMIAGVQQVLTQASSPEVRKLGEERQALYRNERTLVAEALAGGPDMAEASALHDWSFLALRRYGRNFAGRSRATRDLGLLDQLIDEQRQWKRRFGDLALRHEDGWQDGVSGLLDSNLDLFTKEREAIVEARRSRVGNDRMSDLARRANEQFSAYRLHFAEKSRRSRHIPLLQRILANLEAIHAEMTALKQGGFTSEVNDANLAKVADRIAHHKGELTKVQQAKAAMNAGEQSAALADAANDLFKQYRDQFAGRNRREVDPDLLSNICEQLQVIARQMDALHREAGLEANEKNRDIVLDNAKRYEREFERILEAKRSV